MHNIKELKVWSKAIDLTVKVYKATENFPKEEKYGLTSQIRRSAVSVPSNISEGAGRNTKGEFKQFLGIASGSACELQTQLIISSRLNLIDQKIVEPLLNEIEEIQKMNYKLQQSLFNTNPILNTPHPNTHYPILLPNTQYSIPITQY